VTDPATDATAGRGSDRPLALHLELDAYPDDAVERLRAHLDVVDGSDLSVPELAALLRVRPFEVLLVRLGVRVDVALVEHCPTLRTIVTPTTGLDHLDVAGLAERGVRVLSLRDVREAITTVHATAEHTWGLLLAVVRHLPAAHADVAQGRWRRRPFLGTELAGRTIGIVGHGRLGRRVAGYARAFDMDVLVHDVDPAALAGLAPGVRAVEADELLESADVVSLHLTLNPTSAGWLDRERIARLRAGAVVINTARGELVDEVALAEALRAGRLGGVGVDVAADDARWIDEVGASPLLELVGTDAPIVVTPHIGGWAKDAVRTTRRLVTSLLLSELDAGDGSIR